MRGAIPHGYRKRYPAKEMIKITQRKLEIIRLFLGVARRQILSIVSLCEGFGVRSRVQKETIRIILENYI